MNKAQILEHIHAIAQMERERIEEVERQRKEYAREKFKAYINESAKLFKEVLAIHGIIIEDESELIHTLPHETVIALEIVDRVYLVGFTHTLKATDIIVEYGDSLPTLKLKDFNCTLKQVISGRLVTACGNARWAFPPVESVTPSLMLAISEYLLAIESQKESA